MENKFCHSCGAPLNTPGMKGKSDDYCAYCSDENGKLKSKDEVVSGIKDWFLSWQPNINEETAQKRAEAYLNAMPAWAEN